MEINKNSETPIYLQLKRYFQNAIDNGTLKPGCRVASETEVGEQLKISRITVRKAYGELVDEGYFVRKRGKGTYVRDVCYCESLASSSYTKCCESLGLKPGTKVVAVRRIKATEKIASALGVPENTEISYAERLRYADGIPVRLERNYYAERFSDIINENLETSISMLIRTKFGITETKQMNFIIEIVYTDAKDSALLGTKPNAPVLKASGTLYDVSNNPIYYTEMIHLPDRCVLVV